MRDVQKKLKAIATDALAYYELNVSQLVLLSTSYNAVFRVKATSGDFVLRLHRMDEHEPVAAPNINWLRSELVWLQAISRDTTLAVPHPLANRGGELVTMVPVANDSDMTAFKCDFAGQAVVLCSMLSWLEGRFYNKGLRGGQLEQVGRLTATLHNYSQHFTPPADFQRGRADGLDGPSRAFEFVPLHSDADVIAQVVLHAFTDYPIEAKVINSAVKRIWTNLTEFGEASNRFGLIHADIHQWNYLFWHGEVRLLDFNNAAYAHYLYDLAVTLHNLLRRDDYQRLRSALLQGYQQVRPLPSNYQGYLRDLIALRSLQHIMYWPLTPPLEAAHRHWSGVRRGLDELSYYLSDECNW